MTKEHVEKQLDGSIIEAWLSSESHFASLAIKTKTNLTTSAALKVEPSVSVRDIKTIDKHLTVTSTSVQACQVGHSAASCAAQNSFDTLFQYYLQMVPPPPGPGFSKPHGAAKLFLSILCPPMDIVDMQLLVKSCAGALGMLSDCTVALSCVLVPLWLWIVRYLAQATDGPTLNQLMRAGAVAVLGVALFLAADMVSKQGIVRRTERQRGVIDASSLEGQQALALQRTASPTAPWTAPVQRAAATGASQVQQASNVAAAPARPAPAPSQSGPAQGAQKLQAPAVATASNNSSGVPSSSGPSFNVPASHHARASGHGNEALVKNVRQLIISLELTLFGNELTEGVLPFEVLHTRVQKLCEEVGVSWDPAAAGSLQSMEALLKAVAKAVGA